MFEIKDSCEFEGFLEEIGEAAGNSDYSISIEICSSYLLITGIISLGDAFPSVRRKVSYSEIFSCRINIMLCRINEVEEEIRLIERNCRQQEENGDGSQDQA